MLEKGAIQVVFPLQERFISPLFLVSRKDGEQTNDQPQEVELPYFVTAIQMEGLPPFKHAMKEKDLMITIDLKVLAFVCQWANSINPFLGSVFFLLGEGGGEEKGLLHSLWSTSSYYFIHNATDQ